MTLGGRRAGLPRCGAIVAAACLLAAGCWSASGPTVVVYTALDSEFSEPILDQFAARTGIAVRSKFDVESTKTVGLAEAILAERKRPRCDVFWNNEILHTLRLDREGLLEPYEPPAAKDYPAWARSPKGTWHAFAARARILLVNTEAVPRAERPKSIEDLADVKWRGRVGMAKPLFGTTATHAACLFAAWGDEKAKDFFGRLKANEIQVLSGNKQVAMAVSSGQLAFGLTDTDDALVEIARGRPVAIVYPDQAAGGLGTLLIPNTLAVIRGGPHPQAARQLVDYLLSPEIEGQLAAGASGQIPLNPKVKPSERLGLPADFRPMAVDFPAAAEKWEAAAQFLRDEFARGS
jgi:iron(III) transport system substrate-binding protein